MPCLVFLRPPHLKSLWIHWCFLNRRSSLNPSRLFAVITLLPLHILRKLCRFHNPRKQLFIDFFHTPDHHMVRPPIGISFGISFHCNINPVGFLPVCQPKSNRQKRLRSIFGLPNRSKRYRRKHPPIEE